MPARLIKIALLLTVVIGSVLYIYSLNPAPVVVKYSRDGEWSGPLALALILAIGVGAFAMFLFTLILGIRFQFHNWRMNKKVASIQDHYSTLTLAKERIALGEYGTAQALLSKVVDRDPEDVNARILLAEAYLRDADLKKALHILEHARAEQKRNAELLLLAADINTRLGNHTAAYDNAVMVLQYAPKNEHTLQRLVSAAAQLGRYEEALEYQSKLVRLAGGDAVRSRQDELALLEVELVNRETPLAERRVALEEVLKRHREFPGALAALAELNREGADLQTASTLWKKAYQANHDVTYLAALSKMWLDAEQPERALEQVRAALVPKQRQGQPDKQGQLFLVKLLLHLENTQEAKRELELLKNLTAGDSRYRAAIAVATACILSREGKTDQAIGELLEVVDVSGPFPSTSLMSVRKENPLDWKGKAKIELAQSPSPTLSQP